MIFALSEIIQSLHRSSEPDLPGTVPSHAQDSSRFKPLVASQWTAGIRGSESVWWRYSRLHRLQPWLTLHQARPWDPAQKLWWLNVTTDNPMPPLPGAVRGRST